MHAREVVINTEQDGGSRAQPTTSQGLRGCSALTAKKGSMRRNIMHPNHISVPAKFVLQSGKKER